MPDEPQSHELDATELAVNANDDRGRPGGRYRRGELIGDRYRVEAIVDTGSFSTVYLTVDTHEGHPRALRSLKRERAESVKVRRLAAAEVGTWIELGNHPNIVRCYELVHYGGDNYLVMDWVRHEQYQQSDLAYILAQRGEPFPLREALEITFGVLCALDWLAHVHPGAVHADIKPGNILISSSGTAKVTDFGIARTSQMSMQPAGSTPRYSAPEQTRGEELDPRSDLYSVGLIAYELLSGRRYSADRGILTSAAPEPMQEFLDRCLKPRRDDRYASASEALKHLAQVYFEEFGQRLSPAGEKPIAPWEIIMVATTFMQIGRAEEAVKLLEIVRESHDTAQVSYELGDALARVGRLEDAERELTTAIARAPSEMLRSEAIFLRANVYLIQGMLDRAQADYAAAIQANGQNASAHRGLGEIAIYQDDLEEAQRHLGFAYSLEPTDVNTLIDLAKVSARLGDRGAAEAYIARVHNANPDLTPSQMGMMGFVQWQDIGDSQAALGTVEHALARFAPDLDVSSQTEYVMSVLRLLRMSAMLLYETGDYEAALGRLELVLDAEVQDIESLYWRASAQVKLGRFRDAQLDLESILRLSTDDVLAALKLHYVHSKLARSRVKRSPSESEWTLYLSQINWGFSFPKALELFGGEAFLDSLDQLRAAGKPLPFRRLDQYNYRFVEPS